MNENEITNKINDHIIKNSGWEPTRNYLSISHISGCPRRAVFEYKNGFKVEEGTHRMCYAGYEQEKSVKDILIQTGIIQRVNVEVVAPFDERLRGHLDGANVEAVIEIKSVSSRKWEKLQREGRAFYEHFVQCQLYMRYGGWRKAFVVYRNRETYEHKTVEILYNASKAQEFELKAKIILDAIDGGELPDCTCGRCEVTE